MLPNRGGCVNTAARKIWVQNSYFSNATPWVETRYVALLPSCIGKSLWVWYGNYRSSLSIPWATWKQIRFKMTRDVSSAGYAGISGSRIMRGLRINILAGTLGIAWWVLTQGMPLTMFMDALGASGVVMGLVTTLMQLAFLVQVPAALLADRLNSRKPCWAIGMAIHRALWFVPPLLLAFHAEHPERVAQWMLALVSVSSLLGQAMTSLWFSWMADLVPGRIRGRFWGRRQSFLMVANLVAMALAGYLLDAFPPPPHSGGSWWGFGIVFLIGATLGVADVVIHLWVPEPPPQRRSRTEAWYQRLLQPLRNADFRVLTLAMGLYTFSVGLVSLGIVCLKQDFHVTYSHLAALNIAAAFGSLMFGFIWGYALDRIGGRAFGAVMLVLAPLLGISWFFLKDYQTDIISLCDGVPLLGSLVRAAVELLPDHWEQRVNAFVLPQCIWIQLFASFFGGALYGGIGLTQFHLSAALSPREGRTVAMAVHWSVVGIIGAFGAVCAGRILDVFRLHSIRLVLPTGAPFLFQHLLVLAHMASMWGIVLPVFLRLSPQKGELPLRLALSRLLVTNPLRTVANIYALGAPVAHRRARAVRTLGAERAAIAVADLIEKLDDPSAEVREEAVYALGSIGSPEAVDALIAKLEDPNSDLGPQIAKALRASRSRRSVEALLRKLEDPDRETRSESARALGEIGDRRAAPALMELLAETNDPKVFSASSEALARLGEVAAIYEILPRMRETRNPVLKRSLAVAVGDLLGERDEFYGILTREQETFGSEAERMLRELRREIEDAAAGKLRDAGRSLVERTARVQALYEQRDFGSCAAELFDLAIGLAALRWGVEFGGDASAAVYHLIWRDQRFGVGVWFLDLLRGGTETGVWTAPDYVEILLGIYFLWCHGVKR